MKIESPRLNHCVANTSWKKERRWGFCIVQKGFRNGFVWMSVGIVLVLGTEYNEAGIVSYFSGCSVITFRLLFCVHNLFSEKQKKNRKIKCKIKCNFKFQISPGSVGNTVVQPRAFNLPRGVLLNMAKENPNKKPFLFYHIPHSFFFAICRHFLIK